MMAAIGRIDANQGPCRASRENAAMLSETQRRWRPPVIGTNRDLEALRRSLDCEFAALSRLAGRAPDQTWISHRLLAIMRQRIVISATLANRRAEAARQVVDFSRWFNGNGELDDLTNYDDPIRTTFAR
jgi:hypothetical protein